MEAKVDADLLFEAAVSTYEQAVEHGVSDAAVLKGMRLLEATFNADWEGTKVEKGNAIYSLPLGPSVAMWQGICLEGISLCG